MGKTIALIDDSSVMRSILRKAILMSDVEVEDFLEAANGAEGFEVIKQHADNLDVIFTDLDMPERGGVQMMRELRDSGITNIPIVIVSTVGDNKMQETCKELGAVAFLRKPFSHEDIRELLSNVGGGS